MSYQWHSQRQGSFDALRLTWIAIGTKRRKVEKKKNNKNKVHTKEKQKPTLQRMEKWTKFYLCMVIPFTL